MRCAPRLLTALASVLLGLATAMPAHSSVVFATPGNIAATTLTFSPYDGVTSTMPVVAAIDVGQAENVETVLLSFDDMGQGSPDRILGAATSNLGNNGQWPGAGNAYAGLNVRNGSMTFMFGRGMHFVGGFINYSTEIDTPPTATALDENGNPLEDYALQFLFNTQPPNSTIGLGMFIGFEHALADIWGLRFDNGYAVVDNLTFGTRADVPEPPAIGLAVLALAGLGLVRRRKN